MNKHSIFPVFAVIMFIIFNILALPTSALSADQEESISKYCTNIKQALRVIQRDDSRGRINIGAVYESLASHYIVPLNIRLVSNNIASPELISIQNDFASLRNDFSSKFIEYSRSFEQLLATNCEAEPELFYSRLETTRGLRAEVYVLTLDLNEKATAVSDAAENLRKEINE